MEEQNQNNQNMSTGFAPEMGAAEQAGMPEAVHGQIEQAEQQSRLTNMPKVSSGMFARKIADKVRASENILVALSRDPSVDEMAAAIGLTLFLDSIQKHTTAIYSGVTPDALEFLQPEGTFETNTDSLRDFIIVLNKEKADHLRYGVDGDFVRIYITPYKTDVTEKDLEFSHGDYNVNLVIALGVPSAADLDTALAEHGRIMHDAETVDITVDEPGKFGEIEWSDPEASSVSEMVTRLIFAIQGEDVVLDKETATALLTGIVAATGRFSNDRTDPETMELASKLMAMGADQQLISAHVLNNEMIHEAAQQPETELEVVHEEVKADNGPEIKIEGAVVMPVTAAENTNSTANPTVNPAAKAAPVEVTTGPEPVAKPSGVTLPPPPTPIIPTDMMPPAMPGTN